MKHKKFIKGLILWLIIWSLAMVFLPLKRTKAEAPELQQKEWTKQEIKESINQYAKQYKVSAEVMDKVVSCESTYNPETVGDGGKSYGLVQIHMGYWGDKVSIEMAKNPDFALDFLAKKLSEGKGRLWTCYRMYYN